MSLSEWAEYDKGLFSDLFAKPKLDVVAVSVVPLLAPPQTKNYSTVGTAFDYALRVLVLQANPRLVLPQEGFDVRNAAKGAKKSKKRQQFVSDFVHRVWECSTTLDITDLLPDCIVLAHLESIYRSGMYFPDSEIFSVNPDDVKDLQRLLTVARSHPEFWKCKRQCLLNPNFGDTSVYVGGADADLILDGTLVDIKTIMHLEFTAETFRQIVGYWLLNQREHDMYHIHHLGVYYSRFGILFTFPVVGLLKPVEELRAHYIHDFMEYSSPKTAADELKQATKFYASLDNVILAANIAIDISIQDFTEDTVDDSAKVCRYIQPSTVVGGR